MIAAAVGMMVCCSSSSAMMMMMGGEEKNIDGGDISGGGAGAKTPVEPTLPRYLQIIHTINRSGFNFDEVEAVGDDKDTNLVLGKVVTASTDYGGPYPISNIVDGAGTFGATKHAGDVSSDLTGPQKITIDMGADKDIKKVYIKSRSGCCNERNIPFKVQILNSNQVLLKETDPISVVKDKYYFDFSGEKGLEIESTQYFA